MKKILALLLTLVLIGTMGSLWATAEEDNTPVTDGYEFNIANVDTKVVAEKGLILTSQEAYNNSSVGWAINILCEKVADNVYRVKQDAITPTGQLPQLTLGDDDIVISIHSDGVGANKEQKKEALKVKAGMYFTLIGIDLTKSGAVDGKAKLSINNPLGSNDEPAPVQETIVLDGKFDDTGWIEDGWTHVDSTTGRWQTALKDGETRSENYDFQFRTDDSNLYAAFKINSKPLGTAACFGNGNGSNLRIWIFNDGAQSQGKAYTIFNSFINFSYKDGAVVVSAKKQNTPDNNDTSTLEDIDVTGVEVASTNGDNYWYVEAKIPFTVISATTGTHLYTTYSAPTSIENNKAVSNNALFYGKYSDGTEKPNAPYYKWDSDNDIDLVFADIKLGTIQPPVNDDTPLIIGDPMEDPAYQLVITTKPEKYKPGEEITVSVTIKDIKADGGLSLIRFKLYYDKDKVEPVVKGDGDQNKNMFVFLKKAPENWDDSVCKLNENEGFYDISFLNSSKTGYAQEDGSIVIEIPFKVKDDAKGNITFQIPHNQPGTNGADSNAAKVYGNGGYIRVALDTSKPNPSSSSSTTTSNPPTGDVGTFSIAIIAMMALAGAATVAVKKRSR